MPLLSYIDPGSGSMLLQVILASVLAIPFFARRLIADTWHRVRGNRYREPDANEPVEVREESDSGR